jgi:hypothetical protein
MGQWGFVGDIWVISEFSKTIFLRAYWCHEVSLIHMA